MTDLGLINLFVYHSIFCLNDYCLLQKYIILKLYKRKRRYIVYLFISGFILLFYTPVFRIKCKGFRLFMCQFIILSFVENKKGSGKKHLSANRSDRSPCCPTGYNGETGLLAFFRVIPKVTLF